MTFCLQLLLTLSLAGAGAMELSVGMTNSQPPSSTSTSQQTQQLSSPIVANKPSDNEIELTRTFSASREKVFAALTNATELSEWLKPDQMELVSCEADVRVGGTFRYVFRRPSGKQIEVRGLYTIVDGPQRIAHVETYDFSPLKVQVTTRLESVDDKTIFRQRLVYATKQERDEDFDGVVESAYKVYSSLDRYLTRK